LDGVERVSNLLGSTTSFPNRVMWGATTSPDDGTGNYSYLRFSTSNAPIPEPSLALLIGSGLAVLGAVRRFAHD
jgi:hypothetical protein